MAASDVLGHDDFVGRLVEQVPEVEVEVRGHLEYYDELLLHLLMPDLLGAAVRLFHEGELDVERRLLCFIDLALRQGDAELRNAVQASFIENVGAFPGETSEFLSSWPAGLRADLDRTLGT